MRYVVFSFLLALLLSCGGNGASDIGLIQGGSPQDEEEVVADDSPESDVVPVVEVVGEREIPQTNEPWTPPIISSVALAVVTESESELVIIDDIEPGYTLDKAELPTSRFNMIAVSSDDALTGSVSFSLSGPIEIDRVENNPSYTLANASVNIDAADDTFPEGSYTLMVTPYQFPDAQGEMGTPLTINFTVIGSVESGSPSVVPDVISASLVAYEEETSTYTELRRLRSGDVLDLADYANLTLNILAISANADDTGSVDFDLSGPINLSRYENFAVYALQRESVNFNVDAGEFPEGEYVLRITPYENRDLAGIAGDTLNLSFSVVQSESQAAPEPGPETNLRAENDSFAIPVNETLSTTIVDGVAQNDQYDSVGAIFSIITQPDHGVVTMDINGDFTYSPDSDFVGRDQFVYQIEEAGAPPVSATASVLVFGSNAGEGFTAIEPSVDSRVIYVSSSEGSDNNDCLRVSSPCQSIEQGIEKMRNGYPDHLLLKRGDTWRIGGRALNGLTGGRSTSEPSVFAYYGDTGPRPVIEGDSEVYRQVGRNVSYLHFLGLHFYGYKKDPAHPEHNSSAGSPNLRFIGSFNDILLEDIKFEYSHITIQQFEGNRPSNFVLRRNIFAGTYSNQSSYSRDGRPSNLFTYGVDGLDVHENVFDYGGWHPTVVGAGGNQLAHNVYMQHDSDGNLTRFENNVVVRGASHGIQMRSGGLAKDNFFARNSLGLLIGYDYGGREVPAGTRAHAIDNVISEGRHMEKGVDACQGPSTCTSALWGLDMNVVSDADYQAHGNIISKIAEDNPDRNLTKFGFRQLFDNGRTAYPESNNIVYRWNSDDQGVDQGYRDPERTLGTYNASINGAEFNSFDDFMIRVKNRPLGSWDPVYEARAINTYIREGFQR